MRIDAITPADLPAIEAMLNRAFGPERQRRTASLLRRGTEMCAELSLAARGPDGRLLGSVQCWPLWLVDRARACPIVLLGPLAVDERARGRGVGGALMEAAVRAADGRPMMLIGDEPFYGRFGFSAALTGGWVLPGPVERHRLLARDAEGLPWRARVASAAPLRVAA